MKFVFLLLAMINFFTFNAYAETIPYDVIKVENEILEEGTLQTKYSKDMLIDAELINDTVKNALAKKDEYRSSVFNKEPRICIRLNVTKCKDDLSFTVDSSIADYSGIVDEIIVDTGGMCFYIQPEHLGETNGENSDINIVYKDNDKIISKYNRVPSPVLKLLLVGIFGGAALLVVLFLIFFLEKKEFNTGFNKKNLCLIGTLTVALCVFSSVVVLFVEVKPDPRKLSESDEIHTFFVNFGDRDTGIKVSGVYMGIPLFEEGFDNMYVSAYRQHTDGSDYVIGGNYIAYEDMIKFPVSAGGNYFIKNNIQQFNDINENEKGLYEAVSVLASKNIVSGKAEGVFGADDNITRAEIVTVLCKMLYLDLGGDTDSKGFDDVSSSDWYYEYVMAGKEYGLLAGFEDNTFHPSDNITRQQMAVIVGQQMINKGYLPEENMSLLDKFEDKEDIREYAIAGIALMERESIGIWEDYFEPDRPLTRGEAAVILYRMYLLMQ